MEEMNPATVQQCGNPQGAVHPSLTIVVPHRLAFKTCCNRRGLIAAIWYHASRPSACSVHCSTALETTGGRSIGRFCSGQSGRGTAWGRDGSLRVVFGRHSMAGFVIVAWLPPPATGPARSHLEAAISPQSRAIWPGYSKPSSGPPMLAWSRAGRATACWLLVMIGDCGVGAV